MNYLSTPETASRLGISEQRVRVLCDTNRFSPKAKKDKGKWLIPEDATIKPPKQKRRKWPKDKRQQYAEWQRQYRAKKKAQSSNSRPDHASSENDSVSTISSV